MPPGLTRSLLGKLPNETLCHIASYLDEPSLKVLASMCRRLYAVVEPELYKQAARDSLRAKQVLLWAADGPGRHGTLEYMLRQGADPNALSHSFITKTRLDDVFAAQGGRRGSVGPLRDEHLQTEINRERDCRRSMYRTNLGRIYDSTFQTQIGPVVDETDSLCRHYWRWAPIHLAAYRGDDKAVGILLDHGAAINLPSSGLCDCTMPGTWGREYTAPGRSHPVWTSLHISICRGHQSTVQLLVTRGASPQVGGFRSKLHTGSGRSVTAFHSAALKGSVEICKILLDGPFPARVINQVGPTCYSALDIAAASGHINSVFKLLWKNGAKLEPPNAFVNPLVMLCRCYKYDEAMELLDLASAQEIELTPKICNYALDVICRYESARKFGTESLRTLQDMRTDQDAESDSPRPMEIVEHPSGPMRSRMASALIKAGADPNGQSRLPYMSRQTHLKWAIRCNFLPLVEVLIEQGADCTNPGTNDATGDHLNMTDDVKHQPLWAALGCVNPGGEDDQVAIFRALLRAGALVGMSLQHKEKVFVRAMSLDWGLKAVRMLAKYCPPETITNETMLEMLKMTFGERGNIDYKKARWILRHYVTRFQALDGPGDAQRLLAERMSEWTDSYEDVAYHAELVGVVMRYLLEHTSLSYLPRHVRCSALNQSHRRYLLRLQRYLLQPRQYLRRR